MKGIKGYISEMVVDAVGRVQSLRLGLGALALIGLNVCLLIALIALTMDGTHVDEILSTPGKGGVEAPLDLRVAAVSTNFDAIQSHPLFHATREYVAPPDPSRAIVNVTPPDYRMAGAMALPHKPMMAFLVHNQTGEQMRVQKGDTVEGWSVDEVTNQHVVVTLDQHRAEIGTGKSSGAAVSGLQAVTMSDPTNAPKNVGVRVLGTGVPPGSANIKTSAQSKGPQGSVGARLYRPPPGQSTKR